LIREARLLNKKRNKIHTLLGLASLHADPFYLKSGPPIHYGDLALEFFKKEGISLMYFLNGIIHYVRTGFLEFIAPEMSKLWHITVNYHLIPSQWCWFPHRFAYFNYDKQDERKGRLPNLEEIIQMELDGEILDEREESEGDSDDSDHYEFLESSESDSESPPVDEERRNIYDWTIVGLDELYSNLQLFYQESINHDDKEIKQAHAFVHQLLLLLIRKAKEIMEFSSTKVFEGSHFLSSFSLFFLGYGEVCLAYKSERQVKVECGSPNEDLYVE